MMNSRCRTSRTNRFRVCRLWCEALESRRVLSSLVTFHTSLGSFDVELLEDVAPATVENFLQYVEDGDYNNTIIHRSLKFADGNPFIIHGGGYYTDLSAVPTDPPIANNVGLSNSRGTLAMASPLGNPDGATSQWFINVSDNPLLDTQDGGFTVFGRVTDDGMDVVDAIAALPKFDFSPYGLPTVFQHLPLVNYTSVDYPALPQAENLVTISITASSDEPTLEIEEAISVTEGNSGRAEYTVGVTLSSTSPHVVLVDYSFQNGIAISGVDFDGEPGTLVFRPGEQEKAISFLVYGDSEPETDETFQIVLSGAVDADLGPSIATITIEDDDGVPSLTIEDGDAAEGDFAVFNVSLTRPSEHAVVVEYITRNGTATAGEDFLPSMGDVVFRPGETAKQILISTVADSVPEGEEFFELKLMDAIGARLIRDIAIGTIGEALASDINADGHVDLIDFNILKSNFGKQNAERTDGDVDGDGDVDLADFNRLKQDFGA